MLYDIQLIGLAVLIICVVLVFVLPRLTKRIEPKFTQRPLLNKAERQLYDLMLNELPQGWVIMCQVSYGAVLANKSFKRYTRVNSKRADFMLFDKNLRPMLVVEYQGRGHFGNSKQSKERAIISDQIKREALQEAELPLFEVPAKFDITMVRNFIGSVSEPPEMAEQAEFEVAPKRLGPAQKGL